MAHVSQGAPASLLSGGVNHHGTTTPARWAGRAALAALWGVLAVAGRALAEDPAEPGLYTLGEIGIVRPRPQGVRAVERVAVVTAERIQASGAATLDEALALLPGVNVRVGGEGVPRIDMRGFRTRHVLLLLDGVPVSSAVDGQFDPALFPTEEIAAIEVVEGPASMLYGPGGLGGVVNVVTRKGVGGVRAMAGAEIGDRAPYRVRGGASGGADPVDFLLGGSASRVDALPLSHAFRPTSEQPGGYRLNSDRRREGLLGNVGFSPDPGLELGLTAHWAHAAYGKPSSVLGDDANPYAAAPKYDRVPDSNLLSVQAAGDHQAWPWLRLRGWAFANLLDEQDDRFDDARYASFDLRGGSYRQRVRSTAVGAALRPTIELGRAGAIGLLLSAERDRWRNGGLLTLGPGTFAPADLDQSVDLYSLAVEWQLSPLPGLGLVVGAGRHAQSRSDGGAARDLSALAGLSLDASGALRLEASCTRNVRFPSLGDLYAPGQGNPDLGAEHATGCALGADLELPGSSSLAASAFATRAQGLIQTDQATGLATNLADVRLAGLEVSAAVRPLRPLSLHAGYAFLQSRDRSRPGRAEQQYTPRHKATADGTLDLPFGLSPHLSAVFVGDQFFYPRNGSTLGKRKLANHLVVDARLRQRFAAGKVIAYLGASNVLDQDYESSYGFPQPGRYVYAGVELRL